MPSSYAAGKFRRAGLGDSGAVSVQGFAQIQRALKLVDEGTAREMHKRLKEIGDRVALVAASKAPRGATGDLQNSIKVSITQRSASVYSSVEYGGVQNVGGGPKAGWEHRGPHVRRARASHYMNNTVTELEPWVEEEVQKVVDWALTTFEKG